jgi:hypothetical protein
MNVLLKPGFDSGNSYGARRVVKKSCLQAQERSQALFASI